MINGRQDAARTRTLEVCATTVAPPSWLQVPEASQLRAQVFWIFRRVLRIVPSRRVKNKKAAKGVAYRYIARMKSSYELAMERLNKTSPVTKLTAAQKAELADLDSRYAAKIAAREIALKSELTKVVDDADAEAALREQLANERRQLQAELEEKKERVRNSK
jgi:hypothetical protein